MPKKSKKPAKKKASAKQTLVWKRSKPGRPRSKKNAVKKAPRVRKIRVGQARRLPKVSPPKVEALPPLQDISVLQQPNGGEHIVGEAKFQLGPKKNAGEFQAHNLPFEYGKNRVILLVVDPKFVFVYWEVQNDKLHEAITSIGHNAKLTLRFHNIDTNHSWDVIIYERVGNWYLRLDHPEQNLTVEIGMKNDRGDFYTIARSNQLRLPRTGLAPKGPIKWMLVSPSGERVITEIEEYTDADLELLRKILGPYFFDLLKRGKFAAITGSSAENIFTEIQEIQPLNISS